jgi:hypothetical protein
VLSSDVVLVAAPVKLATLLSLKRKAISSSARCAHSSAFASQNALRSVSDKGALSADQFLITNFSKLIHSLHSPKREANLPIQNNGTSTEGSSIFGAKTVPAFSLYSLGCDSEGRMVDFTLRRFQFCRSEVVFSWKTPFEADDHRLSAVS